MIRDKKYIYYFEDSNGKRYDCSFTKGGIYFIDRILVTRGIRGKNKGKIWELLIIGVPFKDLESFCKTRKVNFCREVKS